MLRWVENWAPGALDEQVSDPTGWLDGFGGRRHTARLLGEAWVRQDPVFADTVRRCLEVRTGRAPGSGESAGGVDA